MVADINSLFGLLNGQVQQQPQQMNSGNTQILMTRDLLGNLSNNNSVGKNVLYPERYNSQSPICSTQTRNYFMNAHQDQETCLELKLESSSSTTSDHSNYQSVCTLDKVRSALQRAEKGLVKNKRSPTGSGSGMFAAGCPGCLLYVMIEKSNPTCPRCNTVVSSPKFEGKKPKIDLNASSV
jgi:hypothetical protein